MVARSSLASGIGALVFAVSCTVPPEAPVREAAGQSALLQGDWQLNRPDSGKYSGWLSIDGDGYRAECIHGTYAGSVTIRPETSPAQIDFTIEGCDCNLEGATSRGIFYLDGQSFVFVAPRPGDPRPETFTGLDERGFMIERATRQSPLLPRDLDPAR